jgi:hypothetical protein
MVSSRNDPADATASSPTEPDRQVMMNFAEQIREKSRITGQSVVISKHGPIVYRETFELVNIETSELPTPAHVF